MMIMFMITMTDGWMVLYPFLQLGVSCLWTFIQVMHVTLCLYVYVHVHPSCQHGNDTIIHAPYCVHMQFSSVQFS